MQIDWLTVIAQIVNFLILVWLLTRFLYRPVTQAMTRREERIASRLREARLREEQAEAERLRFEEQSRALARARDEKLAEARAAAEDEKHRLLEEARRDIVRQREKWREALAHEQEDLRRAIERELAESAVRVARRALSDLADSDLEHRIVSEFLRRVETLSAEERAPFVNADDPVRLSSAFPLDDDALERLRRALPRSAGIVHTHDPELLCGIALSSTGHRIDWNLSAYLDDAEERIRGQLGASARDDALASEGHS